MKYTANQLSGLLASKHSQDVFVAECKNGPTQSANKGELLKLDAWAMSRSWTRPAMYGYEIKVSRSDFLQDDKWHGYLEYCNYFSFICPPGLIDLNELPQGVGLFVCTKNATQLLTKRKPVRREIEPPIELMRYVLMARTRICNPNTYESDRLAYWKSWLAEKEEKREIGWRVAKALRTRHQDLVTKVKTENERLQKEIERCNDIQQMCDRLGISPHQWVSEQRLKESLDAVSSSLPKGFIKKLERHAEEAKRLVEMLEAKP